MMATLSPFTPSKNYYGGIALSLSTHTHTHTHMHKHSPDTKGSSKIAQLLPECDSVVPALFPPHLPLSFSTLECLNTRYESHCQMPPIVTKQMCLIPVPPKKKQVDKTEIQASTPLLPTQTHTHSPHTVLITSRVTRENSFFMGTSVTPSARGVSFSTILSAHLLKAGMRVFR